MSYFLSLDQGTTSSRAVIYDQNFKVCAVGQAEFEQHFPKPGWVEHDLNQIWESIEKSVEKAVKEARHLLGEDEFNPKQIRAIGITNQRETFGFWEKRSGQAVGRAVVWQCRRSAELCVRLKKNPKAVQVAKQAGLLLDPYFSGSKVKWLLDNDQSLKKRMHMGDIAFGTMDTYLIARLTGFRSFKTDVSNASRTLLMDLKTCQWNPKALQVFGVNPQVLPEICSSDAEFGVTQGLRFLPDGIPICGVLGDQQAALFGQTCFKPGEGKITYGTGAFMLINTGSTIKRSRHGVSTVAWRIGENTSYAVEGSVFIAGAAVQWLRDGLQLIKSSSEVERLAQTVSGSDGVFFIPALSGLGAPYWAPQARGLIGGLTRGSTKAHLARATLEGIAGSVGALFVSLSKDAGVRIKQIAVDGGAAKNNIMMQYQSDLLQCQVLRPLDVESTARGAAYMAALGCGVFSKLQEFKHKNPIDQNFKPQIKKKSAEQLKSLWSKRVKLCMLIGNE